MIKVTGLVGGDGKKHDNRVEIEVGNVRVNLSLKEACNLLKQLNDTIHELTQVG